MKKNITIFTLTIIIFLSFSVCFAEESSNYTLIEDLPGVGDTPTLSEYISGAIKIGIILAAILAVVMIVVAGFMYITAGGNTGTVEKAKSYIWNAIIGLLIAVSYYLILNTINPNLLNIKDLIDPISITNCMEGNCTEDCVQECNVGEWDSTKCACVAPKILGCCVTQTGEDEEGGMTYGCEQKEEESLCFKFFKDTDCSIVSWCTGSSKCVEGDCVEACKKECDWGWDQSKCECSPKPPEEE